MGATGHGLGQAATHERSGKVLRLLVVDAQPLVRLGLRTLFRSGSPATVVAEADGPAAALARAVEADPDVALVEVAPGHPDDGLDLVRSLRRHDGRPAVVVMSVDDDPRAVLAAVRAGAGAYVLKSSAPAVLVEAVLHAGRDALDLDPALGLDVGTLLHGLGAPELADARLTRREQEVLDLMTEGLDNRAIAERLFVSLETVRSHVKAVLRKTGARDRTHAVVLALRGRPRAQTGR